MANHMEQLKDALSGVGKYTPISAQQVADLAQAQMQEVYDAKRDGARTQQSAGDAALAQQLAQQLAAYSRAQALNDAGYDAATGRIADQTRSRGMQRSNYGNALSKYMGGLGLASATRLQGLRDDDAGNVAADRERLTRQLSAQLAQYDKAQKTDTAAYTDGLGAREYDRGLTADETARQLSERLYQYEHQLAQEEEDRRRWEEELALKQSQRSARSRGGSGGKPDPNPQNNETDSFGAFMDALSGGGSGGVLFKTPGVQKLEATKTANQQAAFQKAVKGLNPRDKIRLGKGPIK